MFDMLPKYLTISFTLPDISSVWRLHADCRLLLRGGYATILLMQTWPSTLPSPHALRMQGFYAQCQPCDVPS